MRKTRVRALKAKFVAETGSIPEKLPIPRPPFVINEFRRYRRAQARAGVTREQRVANELIGVGLFRGGSL